MRNTEPAEPIEPLLKESDNTMSDINDFLNHESGTRGKRAKTLRWTKNGEVTVWLHTKYPPKPTWRYKLPIPVTYPDKLLKMDKTDVWTKYFVSHDSENVHRAMYERDENGQRKVPPKDPFGKLLEAVYQLVVTRKIDPMTPAWVVRDDVKQTIFTAAGFCGLLSGQKIPYYITASMQEAAKNKSPVLSTPGWQQTANAKLYYVFAVVDNNAVDEGVQLAVETSLLGDCVKKAIHKAKEVFGSAHSNPLKTPYAFKWTYKKNETPMNMYDSTFTSTNVVPLTPAIEELITSDDSSLPDDSEYLQPYNVAHLRSYVETYMPQQLQSKLNLDSLFDGVKAVKPERKQNNETSNRVDVPQPMKHETSTRYVDTSALTSSESEESDDLVECDECGKAIGANDPKCKYCGHVYIEETPPPPPQKQAIRKRSELKGAQPLPTPPAASVNHSLDDKDDFPF